MTWILLFLWQARAQAPAVVDGVLEDRIQSTRATISEADKQQREMLSHLFVINKKIKESAHARARFNEKLMDREGQARDLAQDVAGLEEKSARQKERLNGRLRHLYQERGASSMQWIFSSHSPLELERNRRFMRKMVDSDHAQLKRYLTHIRDLRKKREQLKVMVSELARLEKQAQAQEAELNQQLGIKSKIMAELRKSKDLKLNELKDLREHTGSQTLSYAFFERKGALRAPIEAPLKRDYGTYVDPRYRFRLMHKGLFFEVGAGENVRVVSDGVVVLSARLPGYGRTAIVDHGDNYYSVYALNAELKVREGEKVREGAVVAVSGASSPLFGPGVYFEIRHFTDAIDPRGWIKESVIKTAAQ